MADETKTIKRASTSTLRGELQKEKDPKEEDLKETRKEVEVEVKGPEKGKGKEKVEQLPGLLKTSNLEQVKKECRTQVEDIVKESRANNTKFRDLDFDLLNDRWTCLLGLDWNSPPRNPSGVMRVTEVFDNPTFFKAGGAPSSNDILQGGLGDCWFLCALATISNLPRLVQEVCVAKDEEVGVYGFIFYKDNGWVSVIIDDLLCTNAPKWDELTSQEQELYADREQFNKLTRKAGENLTFAKSGAQGETWVPLIEKAYAKFYGNYNNLQGGYPREAIEDLTGGVATLFMTTDILDRNKFWEEQLLKANQDRLFSCYFSGLNSRDEELNNSVKVQGLYGNHAYSVLRARECNGKRFVVVRNPWGESEWTGPWSDGSKEWKGEWLKILPELEHTFGDDGQFVMEYSDFLDCFTHIDRTLLFDPSWVAQSKWLQVPVSSDPIPWSYGDISFVVTIASKTPAVFVLSQINSRFFRDLESYCLLYSLDFSVVKDGESKPFARSTQAMPSCRRVTLEADLEPGKYYVYVRLERSEWKWVEGWDGQSQPDERDQKLPRVGAVYDTRQLTQALNDKIKTQRVATNYPKKPSKFEPVTLETVISKDQKNKSKSLRHMLSSIWTRETKRYVDPKDFYEGLLEKDGVVLGLSVYTNDKSPAKIVGRLKDGIQR